MGRVLDHIDEPTRSWIEGQHMFFVEDRDRLDTWAGNRTDDDVVAYWADKNAVSIDGLPAVQMPGRQTPEN